MGQKFSRLVLKSLLYNGCNLTILQYFYNFTGRALKNGGTAYFCYRFCQNICTIFFKNLPKIVSIPAAVELSIHRKIFESLFSVVS